MRVKKLRPPLPVTPVAPAKAEPEVQGVVKHPVTKFDGAEQDIEGLDSYSPLFRGGFFICVIYLMTMSTNIYAKPVAPYAPPLGFGKHGTNMHPLRR